jgi:hypothetical protein
MADETAKRDGSNFRGGGRGRGSWRGGGQGSYQGGGRGGRQGGGDPGGALAAKGPALLLGNQDPHWRQYLGCQDFQVIKIKQLNLSNFEGIHVNFIDGVY